eukprot:6025571-Amphidinium_carterae.1
MNDDVASHFADHLGFRLGDPEHWAIWTLPGSRASLSKMDCWWCGGLAGPIEVPAFNDGQLQALQDVVHELKRK